jgi:hypothetical protein
MVVFRDDFAGADLDRSVWLPHYLPAWSSLAATSAEYSVEDSSLILRIPPDHPRWCEADHPEPLRVSGVQSGNFSGPVGSVIGQQRFPEGLRVAETQRRFEGWLPSSGTFTVRCRMNLSARSMAAVWLAGFEEHPDDAGELCVVEVFGRSVETGRSAEIGVGVKQVHDRRLAHDFAAPRLPIDVTDDHDYAVEWDSRRAVFTVDGELVRSCRTAPAYPMQVMLAVFDFPAWSTGADEEHVPALTIDWIEGSDLHA